VREYGGEKENGEKKRFLLLIYNPSLACPLNRKIGNDGGVGEGGRLEGEEICGWNLVSTPHLSHGY
jgi:hypothetical protein